MEREKILAASRTVRETLFDWDEETTLEKKWAIARAFIDFFEECDPKFDRHKFLMSCELADESDF